MVAVRMPLGASLRVLFGERVLRNLFIILFIATLAFSTQDVLLEPYGGQVLGMSISATTQLTALWGIAMIIAIAASGLVLWKGSSAVLPIILGCVFGTLGFLVISMASHEAMVDQFRVGVATIGAGRGMFIVGSVALVMSLADRSHAGLFMGLWGMMQALAQGFGTIGGGLMRDIVYQQTGDVALGYTVVYQSSLAFLALALVFLVVMRMRRQLGSSATRSPWAGLQDVPADQLIS
jgi:BCD family chlorophyll transporter-like MFS transporter